MAPWKRRNPISQLRVRRWARREERFSDIHHHLVGMKFTDFLGTILPKFSATFIDVCISAVWHTGDDIIIFWRLDTCGHMNSLEFRTYSVDCLTGGGGSTEGNSVQGQVGSAPKIVSNSLKVKVEPAPID
jgi:hypothetical protein